MSVITRRGDEGQTDLMFGKRTSKTSARLAAYGSIDELSSAMGVARSASLKDDSDAIIDSVQTRLVGLMGELATLEEDLPEYDKRGYARLTQDDLQWIESTAHELEANESIRFRGWVKAGKNCGMGSAMLDLARAICRRAERELCKLREQNELSNEVSALFINRLSDLLWILARHESRDTQKEKAQCK